MLTSSSFVSSGKIQRNAYAKTMNAQIAAESAPTAAIPSAVTLKGSEVVARALRAQGVDFIFGVVGIPVTAIACAAQAVGIRFIGFRNEQSAGYAAGAAGFITGKPALLLTVSGPGSIHGAAGLANAQVNGWPLVMLSGSVERNRIGCGGFQELDQVLLYWASNK